MVKVRAFPRVCSALAVLPAPINLEMSDAPPIPVIIPIPIVNI